MALVSGAAIAGPRAARAANDAYFTPDDLALAICRSIADAHLWANPRRILEPGCGAGAFLRAARATWQDAKLFGVDLEPQCPAVRGDFLSLTEGGFCLALGNPPFNAAVQFVRHSLTLLRDGGHVAFLLPLSFMGGARKLLLTEHPLRAFAPIWPRPSFTGGGTAAQEYGLMIWRKGFTGRGDLLPPVVWR